MTDPQTLNLYSYVRNNPLSRTDKDGHCDFCDWLIGKTSVFVATHPGVAKALDNVSDSLGFKTNVGIGAKFDVKGVQVGFAASVTSEIRSDGASSSAVQGTLGATVNGVGPQATGTGTFVKDGGFVNPVDNLKLTGKGVGSAPVLDNAKATGAVNDERTAIGVGVNAGVAQIGIQVTAGTQEVKGVLRAIGDAVVQDVRNAVDSVRRVAACGVNPCQQ